MQPYIWINFIGDVIFYVGTLVSIFFFFYFFTKERNTGNSDEHRKYNSLKTHAFGTGITSFLIGLGINLYATMMFW